MKRTVLGFSFALAFVMIGCDDEGTTLGTDGGVDAAAAGDGGGTITPATMCSAQGSFGTLTRGGLQAATRPSGMCAGSQDLDLICTQNVRSVASACGQGCLTVLSQGQAAFSTCTANCVNMQLNPDLSVGCVGCYAGIVVCSAQKCLAPCQADPAGAACMTCQTQMGCFTDFATCSGLPTGPTSTDGGASDANMTRLDAGLEI